MSDYFLRFIRSFSRLFSRDSERKDIRSRTPPKYFTPLRPSSRTGQRVLHPPRHSSTPATRRLQMSCPIIQCPSQISLKRFNSESDLSLKNEKLLRNPASGRIRVRPKPIERHFGDEDANMMRNIDSEISQQPSLKSSKSSFDYFSMAGDDFEPISNYSADSSENCYKMFPFRTKINNRQIFHPGCLHSCENPESSKIPVRNLSRPTVRQRRRGRHTLPAQTRNLGNVDQSQAAGDNISFTSSDISNWVAYRNDTTARFEKVFKDLSRKKHSIGNLIDSASHARWMLLSGIGVERDAKIFKLFAGGKVVLNIGEYKFLLEKICKIYDLDYWNVLRKMATFQDEDSHHGVLPAY